MYCQVWYFTEGVEANSSERNDIFGGATLRDLSWTFGELACLKADLEPVVMKDVMFGRGHAASGEGQGGRAQQHAPVQRLLFPLAGRAEDSSGGFG